MSPDGNTVAFVERSPRRESIVVITNGVRIRISAPPAFPLERFGDKNVPRSLSRLRIGNAGAIFATASAEFAGAYMATRAETFLYAGGWRRVAHPKRCPGCPDNLAIAASDSGARYAVTMDYKAFHPVHQSMFELNPRLFTSQSYVVDGTRVESLGMGEVYGFQGRYCAGYVDAFEHRSGLFPLTATIWEGTTRQSLGPGVAFDVDPSGEAVGDDRTFWDGTPHPTLWTGSHRIQLLPGVGSAFAIRERRIVGTVDGRAFGIAWPAGPKPRFFDSLAQNHRSISSAFAIGDNGRILAFQSNKSGNSRLVELIPTGSLR